MRLIKAAGFRQGSAFCVLVRGRHGTPQLDVIMQGGRKGDESEKTVAVTDIHLQVNSWVCRGVWRRVHT